MRRVNYRTAANAAIFLVLWLVMGVIFLWTPIPGALGISADLFVVWMALSFLILFGTGVVFVLAAYNAAFPPGRATPPAGRPAATPAPQRPATSSHRDARPAGRPQER
jgi:hypothetical protein